ncbi:peroxisomal leader peptide-processing protease [Hyla sarda]|uniref:peroxisomal leader peptide-processing protease n=1 Tax=Hyla sarda TaxID=327740 RepID=UPI0024C44412|nr:peroxisomal leader peptide-processing protease [Hyla sarda]
MIKPHLIQAQSAGCVITVSQTQSVPNVQIKNHTLSATPESDRKPFYHPSPNAECDGQWSCSGVILDRNSRIVICQGAVFFPFLKKSENPLASPDCTVLYANDLPSDLLIQVESTIQPHIPKQNGGHDHKDVLDQRSALGFVPTSRSKSRQIKLQARLLALLPCPEFQKAFSRLFKKEEGWVFSSEEEKKEYGEFQKDLAYLHWFAILKLQDPLPGTHKMTIMDSSKLVKGSTVYACGSPFGSFYTDIFLNTITTGVLSNTAGDRNVVLLTDARCLPGSEGGALFLFKEGILHVIGIIVAPLCWKMNEWVGLTVACSLSPILENMSKVLGTNITLKNEVNPLQLIDHYISKTVGPRTVEPPISSVVLVDSGQAWGSGVLLSPNLVLTCRHVIRNSVKVSVKIYHPMKLTWLQTYERYQAIKGRVLFATQAFSPYDIAVVELEESIPGIPEPVLASGYCTGEDVYVVGFGAFGESCGPSVTCGVLSAVISVGNVPVMLQTSCAVHGGSSGGPLFSAESGHLLGIVASNTKDNSTGATYPHLNFSIPITIVRAAIQRYRQYGDLRSFRELNKAGHAVQDVWRLQRSPEKVFQSKL